MFVGIIRTVHTCGPFGQKYWVIRSDPRSPSGRHACKATCTS